ncbi:ABC transporter permease [Bailinhaonella thermotolerans]|uniref:ABC transporter permease subunit n=1 Tax=Bailinhaonella thermotolerans TaxID=1070861 RepID=A0A3A4A948_9ACTN|nr:ABC transporter permease subunit [Bailinhaonella thermotolerans]RJL25125.1 ABC transporter permease subunit [Bailinhaonella thermotolerans]
MTWFWEFVSDPANWSGPSGIPARLLEHLTYSGVSLLLAAAIALPLGLLIGHTGRGGIVALVAANAARALPTLGLLVLVILLIGYGVAPVLIPLVVLAIPPILVNTYAGLRGVDADLRDAARGMGLRGPQVLFRVSIPVALPLILLGLRLAAIQVVSTATVAAFVGLGGLGRFIVDGLATKQYPSTAGGAVLVALLALLVQGIFTVLQRVIVSPGVSGRVPVGKAG